MKSETLPVCLQFSQTAHPPTVVRARGGFRKRNSGYNSCSYTMEPSSNFECGGQGAFFHPPFRSQLPTLLKSVLVREGAHIDIFLVPPPIKILHIES